MEKLDDLFKNLKKDSEERFNNFSVKEIDSLESITDDAYLETPIWLGGDEKFVCLFVDLNRSSEVSNIKQKKTVAKIYDYFTQNIVSVLSIEGIKADYIDVKGDGAFGLYEGKDAVLRAFCAAVTFKTFFQKNIQDRFKEFDVKLNCKLAIDFDKILVRKIGRRKFNNEVWAGKLINNVYKISSLDKNIRNEMSIKEENNLLIVAETIYEKLKAKENYTILSCGHSGGKWTGEKVNLWKDYKNDSESSEFKEKVYYLDAQWCEECGDNYLEKILES